MSATLSLPVIPTMPGWLWSRLQRFRDDPLGFMAEGSRFGADVVGTHLGFTQAWLAYHPEVISRVMVPGEAVWKGTRGARLLKRVLGGGLLTTDGAAWKERRRRAQPRFRQDALAAMPGVVQRHADRLVSSLDLQLDASGRGEVDVMPALSRLALSVVCEVLFGVDPGEDGAVVHRALDEVMAGFLWLMTFPIASVDTWPIPAARRHRAAVRELHAVVDRLIQRRRDLGPLTGDLLADWIVAADAGEMDQADLRAEVITMLLAGHETTANAMAFAVALLGTHPAEQQQVQRALDVGELSELDRAFSESLRLYPPAWTLARALSTDLDLGPVMARPGHFVFIPIAAIHRDVRWWSEPDRFLPDRHRALSPSARAAYLPFGVGPRRCIGEHFARTEARITLAAILRAFELQADAMPVPSPSITLRAGGPVAVRLCRRGVVPHSTTGLVG